MAIMNTDKMEAEIEETSQSWKIVDLNRAIEHDCEIQMVNFEQSKNHFWHSSAHILGSAIENTF